MAARRLPVWAQVGMVTAVAAVVLGGAVAAFVARLDPEPATLADALRQWALWSAVASPLGFVFGGIAFVIARSVARGRRAE